MRGYRIRPTSFVLSILFHVVVVTGLLLLPHIEVPGSGVTISQSMTS